MPSKIERLVEEYQSLTQQVASLERRREKIKQALKQWMEAHETEVMRVGDLKATRYRTRKVEWNVEEVGGLLEREGVPAAIVDRVLVTIVNEEELNKLVEDGTLTMEDVHAVGNVRLGWAFRVDKVKD